MVDHCTSELPSHSAQELPVRSKTELSLERAEFHSTSTRCDTELDDTCETYSGACSECDERSDFTHSGCGMSGYGRFGSFSGYEPGLDDLTEEALLELFDFKELTEAPNQLLPAADAYWGDTTEDDLTKERPAGGRFGGFTGFERDLDDFLVLDIFDQLTDGAESLPGLDWRAAL